MKIEELLDFEEGYSAVAYYCSAGYPTIGIGKKIGPKNAPLSNYQFEVSRSLAKAWLIDELIDVEIALNKLDWFHSLNEDRKVIIKSMAYQLGVTGLLKFKATISAIKASDFDLASAEMMDSLWREKTENRAKRHALVMLTGDIKSAYSARLR